jgi:hypothetical protein
MSFEQGGRVRSHGTRGSTETLSSREAGSEAVGARGFAEALPSREAGSGAMGHVAAPELS